MKIIKDQKNPTKKIQITYKENGTQIFDNSKVYQLSAPKDFTIQKINFLNGDYILGSVTNQIHGPEESYACAWKRGTSNPILFLEKNSTYTYILCLDQNQAYGEYLHLDMEYPDVFPYPRACFWTIYNGKFHDLHPKNYKSSKITHCDDFWIYGNVILKNAEEKPCRWKKSDLSFERLDYSPYFFYLIAFIIILLSYFIHYLFHNKKFNQNHNL